MIARTILIRDVMVLDTVFYIVSEMLKLHPALLIAIVFVLAFVAFKVFAFVIRVMLTGLVFGVFPLIANFLGFGIPVTFQSVLWSAIAGIVIYFVYASVSFGFRITNLVFRPFKKTFRKKPDRVIIREVEKKKS